ncbi:MAG: sodium:calcium antiporter [bacterium]|nr:sodium:calcium antiporter [bacterium]
MIFVYLFIFVVACYVLVRSGTILVGVMTSLCRYFRITEYVFSFLLMAFATTLPELFVGITAGFRNLSIISLGNVIGSNLINLSFILGIIAVAAKGLRIESRIAKKDIWISFFIILLPLFLLFDKKISRGEGFLLLLVFGWHVYYLLKSKDVFKHRIHHIKNEITHSGKFFLNILYFVFATMFLILSALAVVESAKMIAVELYVPLSLISLILIAFGTSLPELVFGMRAAIAKHEGLSLGNLFGAAVVNSTFILGITAIISPIQVQDFKIILIGGIFMVVAVLFANIFIGSRNKLSWKEGLILIGFYLAFLVAEFLLK